MSSEVCAAAVIKPHCLGYSVGIAQSVLGYVSGSDHMRKFKSDSPNPANTREPCGQASRFCIVDDPSCFCVLKDCVGLVDISLHVWGQGQAAREAGSANENKSQAPTVARISQCAHNPVLGRSFM